MKEQQKTYLLTGLLVVIVAIVAFAGGIAVSRWHAANRIRQVGYMMGRTNWMSGRSGTNLKGRLGGMEKNNVSGTVTAVSGNQMTLRLTDGISRTITLSSFTQYTQLTAVNQNSLKVGQSVTVSNLPAQNGSSSAQVVHINPTQ